MSNELIPENFAMKVHDLKIWPEHYDAIMDGSKTCEFRKNDRGYEVGDVLHLRRWDPGTETYTGESMMVQVTHLQWANASSSDPHVILSFRSRINSRKLP